MRVTSGRNSMGGGRNSSSFDRSVRFRSTHAIGQKVSGRFVSWRSPGLAWVEVDGQQLLASLETSPPQDKQLLFLIQRLVPDIVLKHIADEQSPGTMAYGLISDFHSARTTLEDLLQPFHLDFTTGPQQENRSRFHQLTEGKQDIHEAYQHVLRSLGLINAYLDTRQMGHLDYQPWLLRNACGVVLHTRQESSSLSRITLECELSGSGQARIVILRGENGTSHRILGERLETEKVLVEALAPALTLWPDSEYLGMAQLPSGAHGGLPAELILTALRRP